MYSTENYVWGLVAYYLGVLLLLAGAWYFSRLIPWKHLRRLLLLLVAVVFIVPVWADPELHYLAPAFFVAIFEGAAGVEEGSYLRGLVPLIAACIGAVIFYILINVGVWKKRKNQLRPTANGTETREEEPMALPEIGKMAPAFALPNQRGEKIKLSSFKGEKNVVVYFYPKAMTPGCTVQACGIRDSKKDFAKLDTVVLALSPDPVARLTKFEEKQDLNFDLLADEDHAIADKYGVWDLKKFMGREYMGILRTTFIIGKDGRIKHIINKVKTKTHHEDVANWIKENL